MKNLLPMPLLSRSELGLEQGPSGGLPVVADGTTYTMAQEACFVDDSHYAVGRWDGTLSLFAFTQSPTQGPVIAKAVNSPAQEGVQMVVPLGTPVRSFASSNDEGSIAVWSSALGDWTDLCLSATLSYDQAHGVANSGTVVLSGGEPRLVVGHANGFVTVWRVSTWTLLASVDVRSPTPVNPWNLHNVRGLVRLRSDDPAGYVLTASEDGNLTVVRISDGAIMSATVYNPEAQRGINSIAINGSVVLVANCAVGRSDSNLWSFVVDPADWSVRLADRTLLRVDAAAPQVFNFDVVYAPMDGGPNWFFCSTEEGVLWMGQILAGGAISLTGYEPIGAALGSAICVSGGRIAVTAYDLHEFVLT